MKRRWSPRFTLAALLATVAFAAVTLSFYRGYARERYVLNRLSLPSQRIHVFFNTKLGDPNMIDTSKGYILTEWDGPRLLEAPMRLIGCPWFERTVNISIHNDGNVELEDLRQLGDLANFKSLTIIDPQKPRKDYQALDNHFGGSVHFDFVDMRPPESIGGRGITE